MASANNQRDPKNSECESDDDRGGFKPDEDYPTKKDWEEYQYSILYPDGMPDDWDWWLKRLVMVCTQNHRNHRPIGHWQTLNFWKNFEKFSN